MSEAGSAGAEPLDYDIVKILKALPHRYPLLLVDRVKAIELGERIHAVKAVSMNEQFFQGRREELTKMVVHDFARRATAYRSPERGTECLASRAAPGSSA